MHYHQFISTICNKSLHVHACTQELYRCTEDGCSHSYTLKNNLLRHLRTAHGKYDSKGRFLCQLESCGKNFYQAKLLKQHYFKEHNIIIGMYYTSTLYSYLTSWVASAPAYEPWYPKNYIAQLEDNESRLNV